MPAETPVAQSLAAGPPQGLSDAALQALMEGLYRKQRALDSENSYLVEHGSPRSIEYQVLTFGWYRPYLPPTGRVLDWGCNHAPDSCLLRAWYGDRLQLHSCDFVDANRFRVFQDFARTEHRQLDDEVRLPYPANHFDAVIASGVLEHTAMDDESLKELHRVIKPDGVLLISYLPYWLSIEEWTRRVLWKRDFHRRLYSKREAKQLLKRRGFYPECAGFHSFFWDRKLEKLGLSRWKARLKPILLRLLPFQALSPTLYMVARKVTVM